MKKISFINSKQWKRVSAIAYSSDENQSKFVDCGNEILLDDAYNHILFYNTDDIDQKTSKIYVGSLSIGIEYKTNVPMERDLTYLSSCGLGKTGRVDNYELLDTKNLAYRLDMSKKISVFVPSGYDAEVPHEILYFFDAQNLFSEAGDYTQNGDPYGSWQLDLVVSELQRQYGKNMIVVGIDNADEYRSNELFMDPNLFGKLSPFATSIPEDNFSIGYLDHLLDFIQQTLHPFIKEKYCVNDVNIGVGGSSMGGIASFYCGLRETNFFKYVLSYSPAFGLYDMSAFEKFFESKDFRHINGVLPRIHIYCGGGDSLEQMLLPSSKAMKSTLVAHGYPEEYVFETYDMEKTHNEESWRLILCESFSKLFNL